ncbi:tonB-system energizer ExbB [Falsirhodobacter algicola]|uniref:Biopolymer transport protein ExbB n=1 Tax=Falsirhodobacter algicola TaxID=2692330 RepID=A0A8J8SL32_9RHOB|nr:tonB-system energizer ExbB [Falsirhodobacter algicola]QUS36011.1 tonB-system energizer ExbB [Falsirhodobacter algicola]
MTRRSATGILALTLTLMAAPVMAQDAPPAPPTDAPAQQALPDDAAAPSLPMAETPAPATAAPESDAAPAPAPEAAAAPQILGGHDLSPLGMYRQADAVVKAVMLLLLAACFATWTVFLYKIVEFAGAKTRLRRAARVIRDGDSLPAVARHLDGRRDPAAFMAHAALEELTRSDAAIDMAGSGGVKDRVRSLLERIEAQAGRRLRKGTGILASIGSVAPFVGLFGTVWGIMNSFIGIAESNTTNLAVVAPGIAEALLATALGLVAAIPAVVIYNAFARKTSNYRQALSDAGAGVERLVSRDLDFRRIDRHRTAAE